MLVDVLLGTSAISNADVQGRVVVVIDVLRASTTVAVALAHGARGMIPFESSEDAVDRSKSFERGEVMLAGERKMHMIPGFDLGNSPREFTREMVADKTILFTTTNGTAALLASQAAHEVLVGAFVNFSAVTAMVRTAARANRDVTMVCAGHERQVALEDVVCAGRYVRALARRMPQVSLTDGARVAVLASRPYEANLAKMFTDACHGQALIEAGFADDVALCGTLDTHAVVPVYRDRQITNLGQGRAR